MDFRDIKEFLKDISKYLIVLVVVFLVVMYVISFQQIIGPSMETTLNEGSFIAINKFSFKFREIKRNEIIVFKHDEKYLRQTSSDVLKGDPDLKQEIEILSNYC